MQYLFDISRDTKSYIKDFVSAEKDPKDSTASLLLCCCSSSIYVCEVINQVSVLLVCKYVNVYNETVNHVSNN